MQIDYFRTGRQFEAVKDFPAGASPAQRFRKSERYILLSTHNPMDGPLPDTSCDIFSFRSESGEERSLAVPGDERFFSEEWMRFTGIEVEPRDIIPPVMEGRRFIVSSSFRFGPDTYFNGERLDYLHFGYELKRKLIIMAFRHEGRTERRFEFSFRTFLNPGTGFSVRYLMNHLASDDGIFQSG